MTERFFEDEPKPERQSPLVRQAPVVLEPERGVDLWLFGAILALLVIGTVEIYSASAVYALKKSGDAFYFIKRQMIWLGLGGFAMWVGLRMNYRRLERLTYVMLLFALLALIGVLFTAPVNSAKRWFLIGPLSVQPVEFAKLALISYLAFSLGKKAEKVQTFTVGFVPHMVVCAVMMALLLKQPDLGSSIILGATTITMLFIAGARISYIALAVLFAAPIAYQMIVGTAWRMQRFMAYFNPDAYSDGVAYQIVQSRLAIGSGGPLGAGLGEGRQAMGYMPEGHNDFIMASIGEELGFVGFALVLILFGIIVWRGVRAALASRDTYGTYLALGVTIMFALQALINTGVVLGAIPAKGLTLPFVSYGGSSLIMAMFVGGLLLNIGRRPLPQSGKRELVNYVGAKRRRPKAVILCDS